MMLSKPARRVDEFIEQLLPILEPGDIIIAAATPLSGYHSADQGSRIRVPVHRDGGFRGEGRRAPWSLDHLRLAARWPHVKDIFQKSLRGRGRDSLLRLGSEKRRRPYVKDGHTAIEYGDMQLICEAYQPDEGRLGCP